MSSTGQIRIEHNQLQQYSKRALYKALCRDVLTVGSFGILLLCIHELGQPFRRGFNCNDETIRYPYKESTVSSGVCYFFGSGVNVALILILEYINLNGLARPQDAAADQVASSAREGEREKFKMLIYAKNIYCRLMIWLFGAIASELLTDIAKVTAGRLRPHFISVCRPEISGQTMDEYCSRASPYAYITDYICTGDPKRQRDPRLSFLSGHSSYSAYSATFAVIYIQQAIDVNRFGLLKPLLQVLISSAAFYTGLTRVSDYKHHWQDVLAGLLLGTTVASLASTVVWTSFQGTYARIMNKNSTNKLDANEETGAELNRLGY